MLLRVDIYTRWQLKENERLRARALRDRMAEPMRLSGTDYRAVA